MLSLFFLGGNTMDYNQQKEALIRRVPKYNDILQHIFLRSGLDISEYSEPSSYLCTPITKTLLRTYQHYNKSNFLLQHMRWSQTMTSNLLIDYNNDLQRIMDAKLNLDLDPNYKKIYICQVTRNAAIFELAKEHEKYDKNLSLALQTEQQHKIAVMPLNEKVVVILTNKFDVLDIQAYYSIIPIVFSKENLPEKLIDSFLNLFELDYDKIILNLNEIFETIDVATLKTEVIRNDLKNLLQRAVNTATYDATIRRLSNDLRDYYNDIANILADIKATELKKLMLLSVDHTETVDELIEYMTVNKFIKDFTVANTMLYVEITSPLLFIDEEYLKRLFETPRSYINALDPAMRLLFKEAFIDKKIELWTKAMIGINIANLGLITAGQRSSFINIISAAPMDRITSGLYDTVPQPHIMHFSCFGGNEIHMLKAIETSDFVALIAQGIAAVQNLNFGDTIVCNRFARDIKEAYPNSTFILDKETNTRINYNEWKDRRFSCDQ